MGSCTDSNEIYILGNEPQPRVSKCIKNKNGDFLCGVSQNTPSGDSGDNGFWKLKRNETGCKWYRCKTPFVKDANGNIDYSDFSDCVVTNYPYYLSKGNNGICQVKTLDGKIAENSCQDDNCCVEGQRCSSFDCIEFKTDDRFLVGNEYNYKCNGVSCERVANGRGDYTNPFCDYQCARNFYTKNYTCIPSPDGSEGNICKQVSDPENYPLDKLYDNALCDGHCPSDDDISYNCVGSGNTAKCEKITGKSGQYQTFYDCYQVCGKKDEGVIQTVKESKYTVPVIIGLNFILVFLILFFIGKFMRKG